MTFSTNYGMSRRIMIRIFRRTYKAALQTMLVALSAVILLSDLSLAHEIRFTLANGRISYTDENGQEATVNAGKAAADLWVAPDSSLIAFVTTDGAQPQGAPQVAEPRPSMEKNSIYIARKADRYSPVLVVSKSFRIQGRRWTVFSRPSLSADGKTLFFVIPYTMTTGRLIRTPEPFKTFQVIGDVTDYCVIWHGENSNRQLIQRRYLPLNTGQGVSYRCFVGDESGKTTQVADRCDDFEKFANRWSGERGVHAGILCAELLNAGKD